VTRTFVDGIFYKLGERRHDLDELTDVLRGTRRQLREAGLESYYVTEESPTELAREPMERTIESASNGNRGQINRVIFATNSVGHEALESPHAISRLLADLGLDSAFPMGVFLCWCANFQMALELARSLIDTGQEETVLIVCSDVHWRPDRLVSPRISVHSDAAVSFTVSSHEGPFELVATEVHVDSKLGDINREVQFVQYMDGVARGVATVAQAVLDKARIENDEVGQLIPNNYNRWVCRSMAKLAGFPEDRVYLDNVPRFAHALAADNAINLDHYYREQRPPSGEWIALLGSGAFQWGFSLVRVV
jgi:3-oxoacyl-[acyl-carrier-protein] synthase III